jgi:uncharacterized protein YciI
VPRTGSFIVARVKTREEVDALIHEDPFYKKGIADYEVVEFQAVKFHSSITNLV